jgi:phenylpropionate dioxygenase-like ring-hydroxylating dioxygenase large terminal subunit
MAGDNPGSAAGGRRVSDGQLSAALKLCEPGADVIQSQSSYVDVRAYMDPALYAQEQRRIFGQLPIPALASQELPKAGSYQAIELSGRGVILTRTKSGEVKALLNACSHRGARLAVTGECASSSKLTCPYHAWTYALDGRLVGVPREECFSKFEKADYNLVELPCLEAGGIIWVSLDQSVTVNEDSVGRELIADFEAMGLGQMRLFRARQFEVPANWKLIEDAFLEGYHVIRLHAKTLARFFVDAPQLVHRLGRHIRQSSGSRRGFSAADVSPEWDELRKSVVYAYIGFPNLVVVTSPAYVSVMIAEPTAINRTRLRYMMLVDGKGDDPSQEKLYDRSFSLMAEAFGNEDFKAAELSQQGLETGAVKRLTLGSMEVGVRVFHDVVEEYVHATT